MRSARHEYAALASAVIRPESASRSCGRSAVLPRSERWFGVPEARCIAADTEATARHVWRLDNSVFVGIEETVVVQALRGTGVGRGLQIPEALLDGIQRYAYEARVFADR